jgi:hypothetical protein
MQGRVKPKMRVKGVSINGDRDLEQEADVMGAKALQQDPTGENRDLHESKPTKVFTQGPPSTIQRAMKFEFQTRNYVWEVDRGEKNPKPVGRKLGREGRSEDGNKPTFLAVGRQGYPEVRVGDKVKAKGKGIDKTKPAQYIYTYRVSEDPKGKFTLGDKHVNVTQVGKRVNNRRVKGMKGEYNKGTYELIYLDADNSDKEMNVHRDPAGNFQIGKIKRMRKAKKADVKEGTAIELQSEAKGFIEFETPRWFKTWCALRLRIREAVEMTEAIGSSSEVKDKVKKKKGEKNIEDKIKAKIPYLIKKGKRYSQHKEVGRLVEWPSKFPTDKLPLNKGRLIVEIVKGDEGKNWNAYVQPSEGISLTQYESLLKEHRPLEAANSIRYADEILKEGKIDPKKVPNLYSFLQMISYYIERGQIDKNIIRSKGGPGPSKFAFPVMSRTSFSSIYSSLLEPDEQIMFAELVNNKKILHAITKVKPDLDLKDSTKFWAFGHGGRKNRPLTIIEWLESIIPPKKKKYRYKDKLSPPKGGAASMGRFEVEEEEGKRDTNLVKFEVRRKSGNIWPAKKWEENAEEIFKKAATSRKRDDGTDLIYTESKDCAGTYFGHQKAKEDVRQASKALRQLVQTFREWANPPDKNGP